MVKIGICGHYGGNQKFLDGQTVKTKIITRELQKEFGNEQVKCVDTFGGSNRLFAIILGLCRLEASCKNVIILPAHNSLRIFAPLLAILNCFYHRKLHYIVIGGWLPEFMEGKSWLKKALMKFDYIYVETNIMKDKLMQMGFKNIVVLPNCKELDILKPEELVYATGEPYKLCTFSRVMKEKGIEDAVDAVMSVNKQLGRVVYSLDIYGQVDANQVKWFDDLQTRFPEYIKYKGTVDFDKTTSVLKNYFMLLFPTRFYTEGIPGTIIDAYAAGVPVIARRWQYCNEMLQHKVTGYIYDFDKPEELKTMVLYAINHTEETVKMKKECIKHAYAYSEEVVIKDIVKQMDLEM